MLIRVDLHADVKAGNLVGIAQVFDRGFCWLLFHDEKRNTFFVHIKTPNMLIDNALWADLPSILTTEKREEPENLTADGRKNLEQLLQANARLNVAYLLREQFEQLWDYANPEDARAFFDAWREQLRGQDLKPYEKFAHMIEKHWDGIAAYSQPTHKIPLGFVEGFNNKIRVLQRRAFGLRDEEYLKLKILTSGLPPL